MAKASTLATCVLRLCQIRQRMSRRAPQAHNGRLLHRRAPPSGTFAMTPPGYATKQESIAVAGVADLQIRSLLDHQQFSDPLGVALRVGISSATWPIFGLLWPSGARLAQRLAERGVRPGERVLELGCGLALPSLVGHRMGLNITASDCHPLASRFLRANLLLNALAPMNYRHGAWHAPEPGPLSEARHSTTLRDRYDLLIGSDLLYDRDASSVLAGFIGRHASDRAEVWIVDPDRSNRTVFMRQMQALGFEVTQERLDAPAHGTTPAYKGRMLTFLRA